LLKRPSWAYFWLFLPTFGVFRNFCFFSDIFGDYFYFIRPRTKGLGGPSLLDKRGVAPPQFRLISNYDHTGWSIKRWLKSYDSTNLTEFAPLMALLATHFISDLIPLLSIPSITIAFHNPRKGPSTRVRIRVRIGIRFRARFATKGVGGLIIYHAPITTICKHILEKINPKFDCNPSLAPNRTPNRARIRTCRRPLTQ
jgi:hypothetical protein